MAKKNSSKTATEKAIQSSEPRVTTYKGWKGVNFVDAPLTWDPLESGQDKFRQSDLPNNYLLVQNNLVTTPTLGIETRPDSIDVGDLPDDLLDTCRFTGISAVHRHWLFCVVHQTANNQDNEFILYRSLLSDNLKAWTRIDVVDADTTPVTSGFVINEIGFYESNLVATVQFSGVGHIALAKVTISDDGSTISIKGMNWSTLVESETNKLVTTPHVDNPEIAANTLAGNDWPYIRAIGMKQSYTMPDENSPNADAVVRVDVIFSYVNRMGSTLTSREGTIFVEYSPALWSSAKYLQIRSRSHDTVWNNIYNDGWTPPTAASAFIDPNVRKGSGITGIDFYARDTENTDYVFIGHIDFPANRIGENGTAWVFNWLGNMTDISQWENSQLQVPTENTTTGPNVTHFTSHDSRLYYWGMPGKPYRLYIGGNPGAEFSIARGLGGAWVDIEPGSGYEIAGTAKWKTVQGANIVTIMCGNRNTNRVKRFNLVETNITFTNEISYKSYMYEEVSNVVGCNSRYGYGVFADGLYSLSRYGLMLTTMAMEYNSQMRNQDASAAIKPIFTERIGDRLRDGRLVCIDNVIYIALSEDNSTDEPVNLDNVILCYDMDLQAWYTFTHDQRYDKRLGDDPDHIHHILAIDSDEYIEGLGAVTDTQVRLYPTTGIQDPVVPEFTVLLETGELMNKMPKQVFDWIEQLEFRFDYFVGDPDDPATILIEGVDYYGRQFTIEKKLNIKSRGHHGLEGEQRSYIEWIRVNRLVESLRIRIKGHARFRLTHIVNKMYTQSDRIGIPYGYDAHDSYYDRHGGKTNIHHYINDYNNLRRAVVS